MRWKGIEKEIERITINSTIAVSPALLSSLIPRYTIKIIRGDCTLRCLWCRDCELCERVRMCVCEGECEV